MHAGYISLDDDQSECCEMSGLVEQLELEVIVMVAVAQLGSAAPGAPLHLRQQLPGRARFRAADILGIQRANFLRVERGPEGSLRLGQASAAGDGAVMGPVVL